MAQPIQKQLELLQIQLKDLIAFFSQDLDFDQMVYPLWSRKDVLGHLTFWHQSFARNLDDLAAGRKPNPLKGKLSEVNARSVDEKRIDSIRSLIVQLNEAQAVINKHISRSDITLIPYKKGSRAYSPIEHLTVVEQHIKKHLKALYKSVEKTTLKQP